MPRPARAPDRPRGRGLRSEEHTSELQSRLNLVCRLLLEKKKTNQKNGITRTTRKVIITDHMEKDPTTSQLPDTHTGFYITVLNPAELPDILYYLRHTRP